MKSPFSVVIIIFCCMLVISCGKENPSSMDPNPDPDPSENPDLVSRDIGTNGGDITSKDQRLTLTIPAGALGNTETITIEEINADQLGSEFDEIAADPGINKAYELGPDGLEFDMPITVQFDSDQVVSQESSDTAETVSIDLELLLTSENGEIAGLDSLRIEVDEETGDVMVTGELSHFSPMVSLRSDHPDGRATYQVGGVPDAMMVGDTFTAIVLFDTGNLPHEGATMHDYSQPVIERLFDNRVQLLDLFDSGGAFVSIGEFDYTCTAPGEGIYRSSGSAFIPDETLSIDNLVFFDGLVVSKTITCGEPDSPPIALGLFDTPVEKPEEEHWAIRRWFVAGSNGVAIHDASTGDVFQDFTEFDPGNGTKVDGPPTIGALFGNNTLVTYGPEGIGTRVFNEESDLFPEFQRELFPTNPPNITHLAPIPAPGSNEPLGFFAADNSGNRVFRLDPLSGGDFELIDPPVLTSADLSVVTGEVVSIYSPEGEGPALGITERELFWWDPNGGSPKIQIVGIIGEGLRRIVCAPGGLPTACSVSDFTGQMLRFIDWQDRTDVPIIHESIIPVAGPVGIDITFIDEQLKVLSSGFIDHTLHLTTLDPELTPSDQTIDLGAEGCENPGHAKFINHEDAVYLAVTCNGNNKRWVGTASGSF